jgi:hypothetical protein
MHFSTEQLDIFQGPDQFKSRCTDGCAAALAARHHALLIQVAAGQWPA